jgi:hypothetical protein
MAQPNDTDQPSNLKQRPELLVGEACAAYGTAAVARWCADLLLGRVAPDDPAQPSLVWIGGAHAATELRRGDMCERGQEYWARVWAARALRYAWAPGTEPAVARGLTDPAWRVREMSAKVAGQREIGEVGDALADLVADEVPRVRAAAVRALGPVGESEHVEAVRDALDDPESSVRRAAELALAELRRRLDRPL